VLTLPENHELVGFFEAEPELLDPDIESWAYNELKFIANRGEDTVSVRISPAFGDITVIWKKSDMQLINLKLTEIKNITVEMQYEDEFLTASSVLSEHVILLKLRLKPFVAIEFEEQGV